MPYPRLSRSGHLSGQSQIDGPSELARRSQCGRNANFSDPVLASVLANMIWVPIGDIFEGCRGFDLCSEY